MSKSAIYTANVSAQNVAVNGVINPGTVVRRFGPNVALSGNAIQISGQGYYDVDVSITAAPTAAGNVTITMFKDGVAIQGATATASTTTANNPINLSISSMVREFCECCTGISNLTFVLTGTAAAVSNVSIVVEKL
jgi:hypothetical protein